MGQVVYVHDSAQSVGATRESCGIVNTGYHDVTDVTGQNAPGATKESTFYYNNCYKVVSEISRLCAKMSVRPIMNRNERM